MPTPRQVQAHTPTSPSRRTMWCGPFAIAAIARTDYDTAYRKACQMAGKDVVRGMPTRLMLPMLAALGGHWCDAHETYEGRGRPPGNWRTSDGEPAKFEKDARPTLAAWLRTRDRTRVYLVNISHHYLVVAGDRVIDNQMKTWTSVRESKHRRARVENAWRLAA